MWYITVEQLETPEGRIAVIPMTQDDYLRQVQNPFRGPTKRRALRMDIGDHVVEIIYGGAITNYVIRYLVHPYPIILTTLDSPLTIDGESVPGDFHESLHAASELPVGTHEDILNRAVQLAIQSRMIFNSGNQQQAAS